MRVPTLDMLSHVVAVAAVAGRPVFVSVAEPGTAAPYVVVHLLGGPVTVGSLGDAHVETVASFQIDAVGRAEEDTLWLLDRAVAEVRASSPASGWSGWLVSAPGGPFEVPSAGLRVVGQVLRCSAAA